MIGSIYARQKNVLDKKMREALEQEALPVSRKACRIVPASLGELIGDYAAVSVGIKAYQDLYRHAELQEYDIPYLRDRYGSGADSK